MDKKRILMILAAVGIVALLACITLGTLLGKYLREREVSPTVEVTTLTACDVDPSVLCVVSFGADNANRMVINFLLPSEDYGNFYVKIHYDEVVSVYPCQAVEGNPTSVFCTGDRVPLGQTIQVEVYSTDGDVLLAQGTLIVGAIALPTTAQLTLTPTPEPGTPTPPATPTTFGTIQPPPGGTPTRTPGIYP